ncbi:LysM domain [uncultured Caudovirales phage]|uniref:LysM domain n=1 Tax=uncultured Caudovirales phage TaxID=2100421 RepID=A0A6J5NHX5_9CAUD|nr:LysM domain [uncultured Caudovirales phage]
MALGGFDELVSAGATALGYPDPFGAPGRAVTGSSVTIEQIEGDPRNRVSVLLRGRAMPYQQVAWETEQRIKTTWYPGNPVATQQVLGPTELPTTMQGKWKTRYMTGSILVNGSESEIKTAEQAVKLFRGLARAGKLVRVQWSGEVRRGLIRRFVPTYDRAHDAAWELELEWQSLNDEEAPRGGGVEEAGKSSDLLSFLDKLENIAALVPLAADILASDVALIVDTINRVRAVVSDCFQLLRAAETLVNLPGTLLGSLKSNVGMLEREVADLVSRVTGPRISGLTGAAAIKGDTSDPAFSRQGFALTSSSATQELQFEIWRRSIASASQNLLFAAQQQSRATLRRAQPPTALVVTVGEGETLYSLSARYYGAPDYANFLASANRLTSVVVPPGVQLRIPPRPTGANAAAELVHSKTLGCDARCSC